LAKTLGVSQSYVSYLFSQRAIRRYIIDAGKRDAVLLLLHKSRKH
jgi:hypothetical protein